MQADEGCPCCATFWRRTATGGPSRLWDDLSQFLQPALQIDGAGTASRGLLVRHLVMPNGIAGTAEIMNFLASEISEATFVNVMRQYHPCGVAEADVEISRGVSKEEFRQALVMARVAGLTRLGRE